MTEQEKEKEKNIKQESLKESINATHSLAQLINQLMDQ